MSRLSTAAAAFLAMGLAAGVSYADALSTPAMGATLAANPAPFSVDAGPAGKVYVGGALTGLGLWQDNAAPGDKRGQFDVSNAQLFIQKTDGPVQFYIQAGVYSLPSLGAPYVKAGSAVTNFFGAAPVAYLKLQPNSVFSVQVGELPTLIGAESTFTFQNINIARGLLWNQEPAVSRGVQFNYSQGKISASLSLNDGFYSDKYDWLSGSLAYAVTPADTVTLVGSGAFGHDSRSTLATPLAQNNSEIYNLIFTHAKGPWSVTPYLQYARTHAEPALGLDQEASTLAGALLAKYSFTPKFSLGGRAEYIASHGSAAGGAPNLLYGDGSKAWSVTLTPTWQDKIFFVRGEVSYTAATDVSPGLAFGSQGAAKSQTRGMVETGFLF